ncbi:MAG TPA: YIP1 family protein [Bacilli bacterium]
MKRIIRLYAALLLSAAFLAGVAAGLPGKADAAVPYPSYFFTADDFILPVPAPYEPAGNINTEGHIDAGPLSKPQDLFIDDNDQIYIADSGNNRVISMDRTGKIRYILGNDEGQTPETGKLADPRGVFVDPLGDIYIADTGNKRIVLYNKDGKFVKSFGQPKSELLGANYSYQPVKVVVDSRKYFYVVSQGNLKGLMMLDTEGEFRGFFGANKVQANFFDAVVHMVYSKEQRQGRVVNLPYSFNNVTLSPEGFIYATTTGQDNKQVRKMNAVGGDIMPEPDFNYTDWSFNWEGSRQNFFDAAVDDKGNMTIIDQQFGRIYQYDEAGRMLFAFGSNGSGNGLTGSPSSIEVDSKGNLYVLDALRNQIQVFKPTPFTELIHKANVFYNEGQYEKSFLPWQEVLKLDNYYELALEAMGQTRLRQDRYEEAMGYFKQAYDKQGYSDAFYEYRRLLVRNNFEFVATPILIGLAAIYAGMKMLSFRKRKRKKHQADRPKRSVYIIRLIRQAYWVMTHPVQGFEALRYDNKGHIMDALVIMAAYAAVNVLNRISISFLYEGYPIEFVNWGELVLNSIMPWMIWSVVNYGITTISGGEGRFRDVLTGTAYCFTPFIFFSLPLTLLTHALTLKEQNFYDLFGLALVIWAVFLLFVKVKETHSYDFRHAVYVMVGTFIGCIVMIGLYLVLYGMALNLYDFASQIVKEVLFNAA